MNCQEQMVPSCTVRDTNTNISQVTFRELVIKHKEACCNLFSTDGLCLARESNGPSLDLYCIQGCGQFIAYCGQFTAWTWFQVCTFKLAELYPVAHRRAGNPGSQPSSASESFYARNERAGHIHGVEWISYSQKITFYSRTLFTE